MPLIDKDTIKSFLGNQSFLTKHEDAEGHSSAVRQAENIVYQKTGIAIPDNIEDANGTLQFCAHCIYIYIVSTRQQLKEEEVDRRKQLYDDAVSILNDIAIGDFPIRDASGRIISAPPVQTAAFFVSDKPRSERL